ncbi:Uridine 5'-monophosphate synthase [Oopsacas minuta]|uniref:Uridine 5'-monophosphate synthase n=1 Tax=Oopsacas minuta TaxID=111878 RepID=A0AAV7KCL9_9METZ|nr:Uridine 5'-monophosphate synthase [Oopsacas minuta]
MSSSDLLNTFICKIYDIGAIQFGSFTLKSGTVSPVYVDFRLLVSYPPLMKEACELLGDMIDRELQGEFDIMCGVPLAALPISSVISTSKLIPMIMCRPEVKSHGTGKKIEGSYKKGDRCIMIEDIVSSGGSVMGVANDLREAGLIVSHTIVLLDRQQGAIKNLSKQDMTIHALLNIDLILDCIEKCKKAPLEQIESVRLFFKQSSFIPLTKKIVKKTLQHRKEELKHPVAKRLAGIISDKKTNLVLSADVSTCVEVLQLCGELGDYICMLKLHTDSLKDLHSSPTFIQELQACAVKSNFLLLEDRKLADIGNTVTHQYELLNWADLVTVHTVAGPGSVMAIRNVLISTGSLEKRGCLLVTEMSSERNLISADYVKATVEIAKEYSDCVVGLICQDGRNKPSSLLCLTPGVRIDAHSDNLMQTYTNPDQAVRENAADLLVVGRGILQAPDRIAAAKQYSSIGYLAISASD